MANPVSDILQRPRASLPSHVIVKTMFTLLTCQTIKSAPVTAEGRKKRRALVVYRLTSPAHCAKVQQQWQEKTVPKFPSSVVFAPLFASHKTTLMDTLRLCTQFFSNSLKSPDRLSMSDT